MQTNEYSKPGGALVVLWHEENEGNHPDDLIGYLHANLFWRTLTVDEARAMLTDKDELTTRLHDSEAANSSFTEPLYLSDPEEENGDDDPVTAELAAYDETTAVHEEQKRKLREDVRNAVRQAGLDRFIYIDELKNPPAAGTVYLTPDDRPPVG